MKCPNCDRSFLSGSRFCDVCSTRLRAPVVTGYLVAFLASVSILAVTIILGGMLLLKRSAEAEKAAALSRAAEPTPEMWQPMPQPQVDRQWLKEQTPEIGPGPKPTQGVSSLTVVPADEWLRDNLNDYRSSQYLAWSQLAVAERNGKQYWVTVLRLRAKNAFGAYIVKEVTFFIRDDQVEYVEGL